MSVRRSVATLLASLGLAACTDDPPRILEVALLAPTPDFEGPYRIVAVVDDETPVEAVALHFEAGPPEDPRAGAVPLVQTDPGRFTGAIPKQPLGTLVHYRVSASAGGDTTWWPTDLPSQQFTVGNVPSRPELYVLWPQRGPSSGGTEVLLVGQDFRPGLSAHFGTGLGETLEVISRTQARVKTPPGPEGFVDVEVDQPDGGRVALTDGFFYFPSPRIDQVIPPEGPVRGGTRVDIFGAHFPEGARFIFGGAAATEVQIVSPTTASARTPPHAAGKVTVRVEHPTEGFGEKEEAFEYIPPPEVISVSPARGTDLGGTMVTVTGRFFRDGATLAFDDREALQVTFRSSTTLTAITPAHPVGAADVIVVNPDNQSGTLGDGFFFFGPPEITRIVEPYAAVDGGATVSVLGNNFEAGSVVTVIIGGQPFALVCSFVSETELRCATPPAQPGPATVTVTNTDGRSDSLADGLTFFRIRSVTPGRGPASGGTSVIVLGDFFPATTAILFGGNPGGCNWVSSMEVRCVTPPGPPNQFVDVGALPSGAGQVPAVLIDGYFYVPPPEITRIDPTEGPLRGGTTIDIFGNFFQPGATVTIDGLPCANVVFIDAGHLTCVVPPHAAGRVAVAVTNPDGQSDSFLGYTYVPVTFTPNWGLVDGFANLVVRGIGFTNTAVVRIDGVVGIGTTFVSSRELRVRAPARAITGSVEVRVDMGPISDVSPDRFSYRVYRDRSNPSMFGFDETSDPKIADLDGDGDADLLFINGSVDLVGRSQVLENLGGATFSANTFGLTQVGNEGAICDVDGDGLPELTWGVSGATVPFFENGGGLSFFPVFLPSDPADAFEAGFFDVDADGDCDLVSLSISGPDSVLINNGGSFTALPSPMPHEPGFVHDHKIDVADFDGDGRPDIMVVVDNVNFGLPPEQRHRLYLNNGNGTWSEDPSNIGLFLGLLGDVYDVRAGDIDLDGDVDMVMPAFNREPIVLMNDGGGTFTRALDRLAQDQRPDSSLLLEDLEGDGDLDLLLVSLDPGVPSALFLNDGQGFFFRALAGEPQGAPSAYRAAFGDISGDGRGDLLFGAVFDDNRMFFAEE